MMASPIGATTSTPIRCQAKNDQKLPNQSVPGVCIVEDDVGVDVDALRLGIQRTALMGESQLIGAFESTRGFGIACHRSALAKALRPAPWLAPFVDSVLDAERLQRLQRLSLLERLVGAFLGDINALYLNVLVVPPGQGVAQHIDSTLGVQGDGPVLCARAVGVLYVDVPADLQGGELRLFDGPVLVQTIAPRVGRLVLFRGSLGHEVTTTTTTAARISCVAELYALPRARLAGLPRVRMQSRGFEEVLARLRRH